MRIHGNENVTNCGMGCVTIYGKDHVTVCALDHLTIYGHSWFVNDYIYTHYICFQTYGSWSKIETSESASAALRGLLTKKRSTENG